MNGIDTAVEKNISRVSGKPFDHDRYEIIGAFDSGCWGVAYDVKDLLTDSMMVAKNFEPTPTALAQLEERKLTLDDVAKNEYTEMRAPDGIVPTWIEKDKKGKLFLIMPKYDGNLNKKIGKGDDTRSLKNNCLTLDKVLEWGNYISKSIAGYHKEFNEAHCDIKPDNIFFDKKGKLWLGDSGTSTGTSMLSVGAKRSNMGFIYTRAPENFADATRPRLYSDVWSFGSLVYRMFTGKYFLEEELDNSTDPRKYVESLSDKDAKKMIHRKLKQVPRQFRKFMKGCLSFDIYGKEARFHDGIEMKNAWDETVANLDPHIFWAKQTKRYLMPAVGLGIVAMGIIYGSKLEPDKVTMPKSEMQGQVYMTEVLPKEHLFFERDTVPVLKDVIGSGAFNMPSSIMKLYTNNAYVAHFLRAYNQAVLERGWTNIDPYTEEQNKTYLAYTSTDDRMYSPGKGPNAIIAKSLEVAITKSKTPKGTIDLEDVFAIARMGEDKINQARRISGSFDYKVYSQAKDSGGQYIIPIKEQGFIVDCLSRVDLQ